MVNRWISVYNGKPWYGKPVRQILNEQQPEQINERFGPHGKSMAMTLAHILAWRIFFLEWLKGNTDHKISLDSEADWSSQREWSVAEWQELLEAYDRTHTEILELAQAKPEHEWIQKIPGSERTWELLMDGVIDHDIYHVGQIAFLSAQLKG